MLNASFPPLTHSGVASPNLLASILMGRGSLRKWETPKLAPRRQANGCGEATFPLGAGGARTPPGKPGHCRLEAARPLFAPAQRWAINQPITKVLVPSRAVSSHSGRPDRACQEPTDAAGGLGVDIAYPRTNGTTQGPNAIGENPCRRVAATACRSRGFRASALSRRLS